LALHRGLDNAKLEGGRAASGTTGRLYIDGTAEIRLDNSKHDPQPPEAPLFRLPRSRAFTRDAVIKILKSRLLNAGICP
jgi:hypothetical protein